MIQRVLFGLALLAMGDSVLAETVHVPKDYRSIQAAIDASALGDTILVAPGTYSESIRLKPEIVLRSAGDDAKGITGLKRAEATMPAVSIVGYDEVARIDWDTDGSGLQHSLRVGIRLASDRTAGEQ